MHVLCGIGTFQTNGLRVQEDVVSHIIYFRFLLERRQRTFTLHRVHRIGVSGELVRGIWVACAWYMGGRSGGIGRRMAGRSRAVRGRVTTRCEETSRHRARGSVAGQWRARQGRARGRGRGAGGPATVTGAAARAGAGRGVRCDGALAASRAKQGRAQRGSTQQGMRGRARCDGRGRAVRGMAGRGRTRQPGAGRNDGAVRGREERGTAERGRAGRDRAVRGRVGRSGAGVGRRDSARQGSARQDRAQQGSARRGSARQ